MGGENGFAETTNTTSEFEQPFPQLQKRFKELKDGSVGRSVIDGNKQPVGHFIWAERDSLGKKTKDVVLMLDNGFAATIKSLDAAIGNLDNTFNSNQDFALPEGMTREKFISSLEPGNINDWKLYIENRTDKKISRDAVMQSMEFIAPTVNEEMKRRALSKDRETVANLMSGILDKALLHSTEVPAPSLSPASSQPTATPTSA